MLRLRRILRDYQEAGSVNSLIALWGFVDDHTFLTKAGHVGLVYRLAGVDYECLTDAQRHDVVHQFESALRLLDESCRVYQYLCKRRIDPITATPCRQPIVAQAIERRAQYLNSRRDRLFDLDLYLVLIYEGTRSTRTSTHLRGLWREPRQAFREWLSTRTTCTLVEREITRAVAQLDQRASAFEVQLAETVRPTRLAKADAFQFFRRLVNYTPHKAVGARLQYDTNLDYFVADCSVECHRGHLDVDEVHVKVLTSSSVSASPS